MKTTMTAVLCLAVLTAATVSANSSTGSPAAGTADAVLTPEQIASSVLETMDRSADPCQDFYRYACGTWLDTTELPPDRPRWARSFTTVRERNKEVLRELIDGAAADPSNGDAAALVGTYYGACMRRPWRRRVSSLWGPSSSASTA